MEQQGRGRFLTPFNFAIIAFLLILALKGNFSFSNIMAWLARTALILPGIFIGIAFHEFGHAYSSYKLGDITPKVQNRLTLNPFVHIDVSGFLALIFIGFGWGKPVIINPANYKDPRKGELIVSLSGVTMNFFVAIAFSLILRLLISTTGVTLATPGVLGNLLQIIFYIVYINVVLIAFNLIPIPPLDGFNAVKNIFNLEQYDWYPKFYRMGMFIILIALLLGLLEYVLIPFSTAIMKLMSIIGGF